MFGIGKSALSLYGVMTCLAVLTDLQIVTDKQTDGQIDTGP